MYENNHSWRAPTDYELMKEVRQLSARVKTRVVNELTGKEACITVDEMTDSSGSHLNFLLSTNEVDTELGQERGNFYWKSVRITVLDAESIGLKIAEVIRELNDVNIRVNSYSCDNCATMVATQRVVSRDCGKPVVRVPCMSHILNNILKELLRTGDVLPRVWESVGSIKGYNVGTGCESGSS